MTRRCQWGTCEADATIVVRIMERTKETMGHPDWIFGLEALWVCDACTVAARAALGGRWCAERRLSADDEPCRPNR
jgi:hypothetical protein